MAVLSAEAVAQILYQAGWRGDDLVKMVAIGKRESGYKTDARRTDNPGGSTGDFGLFQINYTNWNTVRQALGLQSNDISQLLDPVINAKAALILYQRAGNKLSPWAAGPGGWNASGDPLYGTNYGAASQAVQRAQSQGLLGQNWSNTGSSSGPTGTAASNQATAGGPFSLPPDAKLVNNGYGIFAVFDVGGVNIFYSVDWWSGSVQIDQSKVEHVTADWWSSQNFVDGGNAEELRDMGTTFGTFKEFFDSIVGQVMGYTNPAKDDPDVLRVLAEFASRPDMTAAELQNKLQATTWFQQHTQDELAWNSLGDAERQKRRDEMAAKMAQTWYQFTGESVAPDDPRILNYLEDVSSGKMGIGNWTETIVKPAATDIAESPWSRQLVDEQKAQKQTGIDVENTAQRVLDLSRRWGLQWSPAQAQDWARRIVNNDASEADVLQTMKDQAAVLYPWKQPDQETGTAAQPWIDTYNRVMEQTTDLFNPKVQAALSAGQPVWEFEKSLKKTSSWLNTKNAREEMVSTVAEAGRRLGFV